MVAGVVLAINFVPPTYAVTTMLGLLAIGLRGRRRVLHPAAPRQEPALRPRSRRPTHLLGRRGGRDHRLRHPDGGHVHRPAVPAERARLLDPRFRPRDPARSRLPGADRSALGKDGRTVRSPGHPAGRLPVLLPRLRRDAHPLGRRRRLLEDRPRLRPGRGRRRIRRHPGLALADLLGSGAAGGHGLGDLRPPARPRRGDHAVDARLGADRRLYGQVRRR